MIYILVPTANLLFFCGFALLFVLLFVIFAILRPLVKARINVFYCGFCYATTTVWGILLILWFFDVFTPPFELLAILLGMSAMGIWEELKKRAISNFGIFTILWILFSVFVFYSIETLSKVNIIVAVAVFLLCDAYILTRAPVVAQSSAVSRDIMTAIKSKSALDDCCD